LDLTENPKATLLFHNSLSVEQKRIGQVRIKLQSHQVKVYCNLDSLAKAIPLQVTPIDDQKDLFDVHFEISIPPLGYRTYTITKEADKFNTDNSYLTPIEKVSQLNELSISNSELGLQFNNRGI